VPPGTGKSHLILAFGVEAVKAGRSVYFGTLADIIGTLAKTEREGARRSRRDRLPPSHPGRRHALLPARQCPLKKGGHDLDLKSRIFGMGTCFWGPRGRHSFA
jgi:IstB-like ATP binding protein